MLKKLSLTFVYLFYAVVLIAVLLVVRFPKDTLLTQIERKVEGELSGYTCEISSIKYIYPISVLFEDVTIVHSGRETELPVTNVLITPDLKNVMTQFEMSLDLLGGTLKTGVVLHPESNRVELPTLAISGINLKEVGFIEQDLSRGLEGIFELSGRYIGDSSDLTSGEFSGTVRVKDYQMELKRPILQSKQVVFTEASTFAQMRNGLIEVFDGKARGPFYDGDFTGSIKLRELWRASVLALNGTISPKQEYIEKNRQVARAVALLYRKYKSSTIPFRLTGNLEDPVFAFGTP